MQQFWFTDDWTPSMFQAFMVFCWVNKEDVTPRAAKQWQKNVWNKSSRNSA